MEFSKKCITLLALMVVASPTLVFGAIHGNACDAQVKLYVGVDGLPVDSFIGVGLKGHQILSQNFYFDVTVVSSAEITPQSLVGKGSEISIVANCNNSGIIRGIVTSASLSVGNFTGNAYQYRISIEPSLQKLGLSENNQVYQNLAVTDIVQNLLNGAGILDASFTLQNFHAIREFAMMRAETPLQFMQRLLDSSGIFYYFSQDRIILGDSNSAFTNSTIVLDHGARNGQVAVNTNPKAWEMENVSQTSIPGATVLGFNFKTADLQIRSTSGTVNGRNFYYNPSVKTILDADNEASIILGRAQAVSNHYILKTDAPGLYAGINFAVSNHPIKSFNANYIVTRVEHQINYLNSVTTGSLQDLRYYNIVHAIPELSQYVPPLRRTISTPAGVTTAIVTGPAGEKRWVDDYGRIKVQFHWDQKGTLDENSSAWLRVVMPADRINDSQLYIPEIGTEVVVDFIEGKPSLPIVMGSLYNSNFRPPASLPENRNLNDSLGLSLFGEFKFLSFTTASHGNTRLTSSQLRRSKGTLTFDGIGGCVLTEIDAFQLTETYSKKKKRVKLTKDNLTIQQSCT